MSPAGSPLHGAPGDWVKSYLEDKDLAAKLQKLFEEIEEHLTNHEYETALEAYGRSLEALEEQEEPGVVDQAVSLRDARAGLLMQLGQWDRALEDLDWISAREEQASDRGVVAQALIKNATISSNYGDFNQAISVLERALQEAEAHGGRVQQALAHVELGAVLSRIGEHDQGQQSLEQACKLLDTGWLDADGLQVQAAAFTQRGLAAFRDRDLEKARAHYERALESVRPLGAASRIEADTLRYLGVLSSIEGSNAEALHFHREALRMYMQLRIPLGVVKTYNSIGQTCLEMSRLDEALFFMHKAERLSRRLGSDAESAAIYGKLGNIYIQMGDYSRAVEFHLKDIDMCRRFGNYRALAYAMRNLGLSYRGKGDIEEAIHYLQESLQRFEELQDESHTARLHLDLARSYLDRSRLPEAEESIDEANHLLEKSGDPTPDLGYSRLLLGTLHRVWQNLEVAERSLKDALNILGRFGASTRLAEAHYELGLLYSDLSQNQQALEQLKSALRLARRLEMRNLMLDSIQQLERLDEFTLVDLLVEDVDRVSQATEAEFVRPKRASNPVAEEILIDLPNP